MKEEITEEMVLIRNAIYKLHKEGKIGKEMFYHADDVHLVMKEILQDILRKLYST